MRVLALAFLLVPLLAGCASDPVGEEEAASLAEDPYDPWQGMQEQVLLARDSLSCANCWQFDFLCAFGGGIHLERGGEGYVLPGSKEVAVTVVAPASSTGLQVGYVLTTDPQSDERLQQGITWFDVVQSGERTFTVPVQDGQTEWPGEPTLWQFYQRMDLPVAGRDCYTGIMLGGYRFEAKALRE